MGKRVSKRDSHLYRAGYLEALAELAERLETAVRNAKPDQLAGLALAAMLTVRQYRDKRATSTIDASDAGADCPPRKAGAS